MMRTANLTGLSVGVLVGCSLIAQTALADPPANDVCNSALPITIVASGAGSVAGDNTSATDDTAPLCGLSTFNTIATTETKGVWYTFTGTGNRLDVGTCGGAALDLQMRVYCGDCTNLIGVASDDGGCTTGSLTVKFTNPELQICTDLGKQYWILLSRSGASINAGGAFTLNWSDNGLTCSSGLPANCSATPPINDDCSGAIRLSLNTPVIGNTALATPDSVAAPTCSTVNLATGNTIWYTFIGNGANITASTCSPNTGSDTRVVIFTGSCGDFTCVNGSKSTTCGFRDDAAAATATCTVPGQLYYVVVASETGAGVFELTLTTSACTTPPVNDNCVGALTLVPGVNRIASTLAATDETSPTPPNCNNFSGWHQGVWYTFTPNDDHNYTLSTCNPATNFNTRIYLYTGSCQGVLDCVDANATAVPACSTRPDAATLSFCADPGVQYFVIVCGDNSESGTLELSLADSGFSCNTGACCNGTACTVTTADACTGPGKSYAGNYVACSSSGHAVCCKADFDGNGTVNVNDIFAFLRAWFAHSASADIDGIGGVNVNDIFAFLRAWFAKC